MDSATKRIVVIVAMATIGIATISIIIAFLALTIILHDGAQTADLVNKLMNLASAGVAAMITLLGINHGNQASVAVANTPDGQATAPPMGGA